MKNFLLLILIFGTTYGYFDINRLSYSNIDEVVVKSYFLDLTIDFTNKILNGSIAHIFKSKSPNLKSITLDINSMKIYKIMSPNGHELSFKHEIVPEYQSILGDKLVITLNEERSMNQEFSLRIFYSTIYNPKTQGINWLEKEQTAGNLSFLYTMCEPNWCRSIAPLQDTPAVKSTFTVVLYVAAPYRALASGRLVNSTKYIYNNIYIYTQSIPVPSYLLAIVSGDLEYKKTSGFTGIYGERAIIDKAVRVLSDVSKFIISASRVLTPYLWEEYNIVIMPQSFPHYGMENPYLTFANPIILVEDKSLEYVAVHEIMHSWTGNLVTAGEFKDIWLTEGFTVWMEVWVVRELFGGGFGVLEGYQKYSDLMGAVRVLGVENPLTALILDMGILSDPQDAFGTVQYMKGWLFVEYLYLLLGGELWFEFLRVYLTTFMYESIDSGDFRSIFECFVRERAPNVNLDQIDWDKWYYGLGYPPMSLTFNDSVIQDALGLAVCYLEHKSCDYNLYFQFVEKQKQLFFNRLEENIDDVDQDMIQLMQDELKLLQQGNLYLLGKWLYIVSYVGYMDDKLEDVFEDFLGKVGVIDLVTKLYKNLHKNNPQLAKTWFLEHRKFYDPIVERKVAEILGISTNMFLSS